MPFHRGDVVDRYRLEEFLGVGAFGEVWKANQLANGEPIGITCALKVMRLAHDRIGSSPRTLPSGWLDEAQHLVRVAGSTVPRIHEANVWNEHAYIAMELLDGTTLHARLAQGPIAWRRALFIADQIATALEEAHKIRLIHRDLKPQNVMLAGPRRCCVLDWGIARLHTPSPAPVVDFGLVRQSTNDVETTDAAPVIARAAQQPQRMPVGTPGYMAPEVYDGAHPAPAQDVYSLGVVLYEMIAGSLPHAVDPTLRNRANPDSMKAYRAALDKATMDHALIPLRERCPGVPDAVADLVDALVSDDPKQRPAELRNAIGRAGRFAHGIPDPPYAGLSTMGLQHAGLYFGQRDAIQRVLDHLQSQRAALLWGPSGSGKSSLALAGVAATMDRSLFLDMDGWHIHVVRPRDGMALGGLDGPPAPRRTLGQVVVLDQLEEVVDLQPAARDAFCAAVLALLERSAPVVVRDATISVADEVKVIATIRDDLEWRVDREAPSLRPLLERRIIVKGFDVNLARSIIEEPARAHGYQVEGVAAVAREVEDCLSAEPANLPVVQYALSEWWERRDRGSKALPVAAWKDLGGVAGALSFVAERFFSALDDQQEHRVKALFIRLFHRGRKQPLAESALDSADRFLMDQLVSLRLVGRRDKKGSEPFYEVEHEYLSRNWTRLDGWLAEARDDQALAEELSRDAAAYVRDQDPERLWRKGRLTAAAEMARRGRVVLDDNASRFLQHSRRRDRRGRVFLRAAIGIGLAAVLTIVYTVIIQRAAAQERADARIDRQRAEQEYAKASESEAGARTARDSANAQLVRAKEDVERQLNEAREDAKRIRETAESQAKEIHAHLQQETAQAGAALKQARDAASSEQRKAIQWKRSADQYKQLVEPSTDKPTDAEQRADPAKR